MMLFCLKPIKSMSYKKLEHRVKEQGKLKWKFPKDELEDDEN